MLLLSSENSNTCVSPVIDSTEYLNEGSGQSVPIAILDPKRCPNFKFSLAHVDPNLGGSYKRISLPRVEKEPEIRKVNQAVRANIDSIETRDGAHRTALSQTPPVLYAIPGKPDVYIAVFQNTLIPGDETHVLYAKGIVSKIHGAANTAAAFTLANRVFVHYTFTCNIGCGYRGDFIVEISERGASVVFFDDSSST
jgi:hypothetical protein